MISDADLRRFRSAYEAAEQLVLVTHINPDGDAIGSQCALTRFLLDRGKAVRIINQDPTPDTLRFVTPPEPRIERYAPAEHDPVLTAAPRLVLVDNSAPDRLGRMERVMRSIAARTLCIDHHPTRDAPWAENIVDVEACATTAMLYELTRRCGWTPDAIAARAIYVGLATDTGFFRFNSTNAQGHEIAAELLRAGVEPAAVYQQLHERNSEAFVRLLGHALTGLRLDGNGGVASVCITRELVASLQAEEVDPGDILNTLLAMDGVKVAILFRELSGARVKVSLRSKGMLDVHRLATEFGGGGHRNASGIVLPGTIDAAVETVTGRATGLLAQG